MRERMIQFTARPTYLFDAEICGYTRKSKGIRQILGQFLVLTGLAAALAGTLVYSLHRRGFDAEAFYLTYRQEKMAERFQQYASALVGMETEINAIHRNDQTFYRSILNKKSIDPEIWEAGVGGSVRTGTPRFASPTLQDVARRYEKVLYKLSLQKVSFEETARLAELKSEELKHIPAILPINGRTVSGFGYRSDPFHGHGHFHAGVDISAPYGAPIFAAADGVVITSGTPEWGYGLQVEIDHGYGFVTKYAHLSQTMVQVGQKVKRGAKLGLCGSSGYSTGPHLHYEVIRNGVKVNPEDYYYSVR